MIKSKAEQLVLMREELKSRRKYREYCHAEGWHDRAREWNDYISILERDVQILELQLQIEGHA